MNHTLGYVKFADDNDVAYFPVDIALVREWFHEFEISIDTFSDIGFEEHNGDVIINYQPMNVFSIFKKLYCYVYFKNVPTYDDTNLEEQVEFIQLVCKLMTSDKISKIVEGINFDKSLWLYLPNLDFDAKNYFNDDAKNVICHSICKFPPKYDFVVFFNFYDLQWFEKPSDIYMTLNCFVRDVENKCEYEIVSIDDKCVMLYKKHYVYESTTTSIHTINVRYMNNISEMKLAKPEWSHHKCIEYKNKYMKYKNKYQHCDK
uniref:Uncharacterized protein n=1 Tax=viral metagenome TaxID=1070528 RepID=A0A6C0C7T4_9ZZZZ